MAIRRVSVPTTRIVCEVPRPDERYQGFNRARDGALGPELQQAFRTFVAKYPTGATLAWSVWNVIKGKSEGEPSSRQWEIKDVAKATQHIKDVARFFRADDVGVCELPPYAIYTHGGEAGGGPINLNHKYAIAILVDQDYRTMRGSTGMDMISNAQSFRGYSHSGFIAVQLAQYIRRLGYPARAHFHSDYQVVLPPILLWAGLGELGRSGVVLHPELGMRFKAAVVTTDMPLIPDKPIDFGLQDFCDQCKKCAKYCPSKAINPGAKSVRNGYETWVPEIDRCVEFRVGNKTGSACGRCIKVCPWNRKDSWYHRIGIDAATRWRFAQWALIKIDELLKSNLKAEPEDRWWRVEDFAELKNKENQ